jgi:lipoate-protein ligase A
VNFLDLTLPTPAENLACDEGLLDQCEETGEETLRFWESREVFVVVGYGNRIASEVNVEECERRGVPILRRCSGGGTVVQGPGCLNYNLTLRIPESGPLTSVTGTNEFVMERNRAAMEKLLKAKVSVQGHTDLAVEVGRAEDSAPCQSLRKFSGNAQRRRRRALVFHGTILYAFDLPLIEALLRFPSAQPDYRAGRGHTYFVQNVSASRENILLDLGKAWGAKQIAPPVNAKHIEALVRERYANTDWNCRR